MLYTKTMQYDQAFIQQAKNSLLHPGQSHQPLPKLKDHTPPILFIFRHCQSKDNARHLFSGHRQTALTSTGLTQAKQLAKKMSQLPIDLFIAPPLKRCLQTVNQVRQYHPEAPLETYPQLMERDYGDLSGKSKVRMMNLYPQKTLLWRRSWDVRPPHGESLQDVWEKRLKHFLTQTLIPRMKNERINVAWSATNNTMRLVRMYFENLSIKQTLLLENPYADWAEYSLKARS